MNKKQTTEFLAELVAIGERQLAGEKKARTLIEKKLREFGVPYRVQPFTAFVPLVKKEKLVADGISIPARATSFTSGMITGKGVLISSLTSSQNFLYEANINFNPLCEGISRSNHYFAPALAISKNDVAKVLTAKKVLGEVRVQKMRYQSANILVGNTKNPKRIFFCHYDSFSGGAADNASGVATCLLMISCHPKILGTSLFVIAGNEELSYDQPLYWGHGYRIFEESYRPLLARAKSIFVLDCIGYAKTEYSKDPGLTKLSLPLKDISKLQKKITAVSGDYQTLMPFYHSDLDTLERINPKILIKTADELAGKE